MAVADAISEIAARVKTLGYVKRKTSPPELAGADILDKVFFITNEGGGGGLDAQFGTSKYDVTENMGITIFRLIGDDYTTTVQNIGTDRETIVKDMLNHPAWVTSTSGIALVTYQGHTQQQEDGGVLRDEINFGIRIRRTL